MECPNCAGKNRDTALYCNRCGQRLVSASESMSGSSTHAYVSRPEQLVRGIVCILDAKENIAGTGFVISDSGLIATCSHVIQPIREQRDGKPCPEKVTIVFHATGDKQDARTEPDWWLPWDSGDVAILRTEGILPQGVHPLLLGSVEGTSGHDVCTFGFPDTGDIEGIGGDGKVVRVLTRGGRSILQLRSSEITIGFSGAPVWDTLRRRVIGMVSDIAQPVQHRLVETAFAVSTETLQQVCSKLHLSDVCPYRGLSAFTEADAEFFFGRQQVVDGLLNRLRREPRFLTVLGPSGSGKSSAVQAGLIPQLKHGQVPGSDRWGIIVTRPTTNPFDDLAKQGLVDASNDLTESVKVWLSRHTEKERFMLVLDQFEELFAIRSEALRRTFITQLAQLIHSPLPISVIVVMRDDFYSHFTQQEALVELLEQSQGPIHIPRTLKRDELIAIVRKPVEAVGLRFEEGLVEAIVTDTMEVSVATEDGGQAGRSAVLPLLEFALTELWKRRQEGMLTHEVYRKIGGVAGALTQWADSAYYSLKKEERDLAQRIFTDLVYIGEETQGVLDSRRRRTFSSLCRNGSEQESVQRIVQHLVEKRLLVTDRDLQSNEETTEIIHDVLLREWGRLKTWIETIGASLYGIKGWKQRLKNGWRVMCIARPNGMSIN
jgi:Trypsin-like peptidase domain